MITATVYADYHHIVNRLNLTPNNYVGYHRTSRIFWFFFYICQQEPHLVEKHELSATDLHCFS